MTIPETKIQGSIPPAPGQQVNTHVPDLAADLANLGISMDEAVDSTPDTEVKDPSTPPLEEPNKEQKKNDDSPENKPDEDVSQEEKLRKERAIAIAEAVRKDKERAQAVEEVEFYKNVAEVAKDPNKIHALHDTNPVLADKVAKEHFGHGYTELLREQIAGNKQVSPANGAVDENYINSLVEQKIQERLGAGTQSKTVDTVIENYFVDNNIQPNSATFENMMKDIRSINTSDPEQMARMLPAIHQSHSLVGTPSNTQTQLPPSNPSSVQKTSTGKKQVDYKDALNVAKAIGMDLSEEDFKKYGNRK